MTNSLQISTESHTFAENTKGKSFMNSNSSISTLSINIPTEDIVWAKELITRFGWHIIVDSDNNMSVESEHKVNRTGNKYSERINRLLSFPKMELSEDDIENDERLKSILSR